MMGKAKAQRTGAGGIHQLGKPHQAAEQHCVVVCAEIVVEHLRGIVLANGGWQIGQMDQAFATIQGPGKSGKIGQLHAGALLAWAVFPGSARDGEHVVTVLEQFAHHILAHKASGRL